MFARYQTYRAMVELDEFTVADLADASGVKPSTIRTILDRAASLLDVIGAQPSSGPGGRYRVYRLKPSGRRELQNELNKVGMSKDSSEPPEGLAPVAARAHLPDSLVAAEDLGLRELFAVTDEDDRHNVLQMMELGQEEGRDAYAVTEGELRDDIAAHHDLVSVLVDLARAFSGENSRRPRAEDLYRFCDVLFRLSGRQANTVLIFQVVKLMADILGETAHNLASRESEIAEHAFDDFMRQFAQSVDPSTIFKGAESALGKPSHAEAIAKTPAKRTPMLVRSRCL